ncbi:Erythroid membrane-associated protein [Dissostichus eleginoides]|uniref:Erythroid membrane-associated protein n=1 Tax=Dissostichus eleginoides TaxID=100907 RepID=A0AAD9F4M3_DISEL|nr:Erythroid membrane-associated protein [Dissostichus eleginoides]
MERCAAMWQKIPVNARFSSDGILGKHRIAASDAELQPCIVPHKLLACVCVCVYVCVCVCVWSKRRASLVYQKMTRHDSIYTENDPGNRNRLRE